MYRGPASRPGRMARPFHKGERSSQRGKNSLQIEANGCPCGFATDPVKECTCTPLQIQRYLARISGPLLDRIDIHIDVPPLKHRELGGEPSGESSAVIRERVQRARQIQQERFRRSKAYCNAQMSTRQIRKHCQVEGEAKSLLELAMERLGLSARAYDRILKVARTVADLEGAEGIQASHIAEAIQYRSLDRGPRR